jgi:hypothetical protein
VTPFPVWLVLPVAATFPMPWLMLTLVALRTDHDSVVAASAILEYELAVNVISTGGAAPAAADIIRKVVGSITKPPNQAMAIQHSTGNLTVAALHAAPV